MPESAHGDQMTARYRLRGDPPGRSMPQLLAGALLLVVLLGDIPAMAATPPFATVETEPVPDAGDAADDAAIWVHPTDPALSTIIGTNKDGGGLAVYDLTGSQVQYLAADDANNVDLR